MKIFVIIFLLTSSFFAQSYSTRYDVNVGMFGRVGYADFTLKVNGDNYEAKLSAIMVGVAATLTGNWVETFTSNGNIVDGKYIPQKFIKTKNTTRKSRIQTYYFDHDKKEVKLVEEKTKIVSKSRFDTTDFQICYEDVNETSHKEEVLETYIADDSLSAYLNTKLNANAKNKIYNLVAIGAHNDENNVTLSFLDGSEKESALLNFSSDIETVYNIHVEPFDKEDKIVDVLVAFDKDGYMKEALLGEVFWIGKITADRVDQNIAIK
ncbi:MAG: DUF3108 domain-containing protein [Sulfurimonas sp.]|uniref:DUF3108 domain-containing protein n=1 Tax=Sulfurimonas sp. TaxID=2022749 RepID=UPI002603DB57|nr:DUF3108 domain-containing protein [Sulfurimonas sp.]MCW8894678.1 DUF3108 domain-containing protein [Sulfurimonas sp.]MCW8953603.1 DUF3108 domain-containing protein [Sulfurimonas sp.]MCW9067618.1 DUF3108 domain-containing protein [Sulfurimonas sp.]